MVDKTQKKSSVVKSVWAAIIVIVYGLGYTLIQNVYYPSIVNRNALTQLEDTAESYTNLATFNLVWKAWEIGWVLIVLIIILMFRNEIGQLFTVHEEE